MNAEAPRRAEAGPAAATRQRAAKSPATPVPTEALGALATLQQLLKAERAARLAKTLKELWFVVANDSRRPLSARQAFVLEPSGAAWRIVAVSSLSSVDRDSSTIRWLERLVAEAMGRAGAGAPARLSLDALAAAADPNAETFPFAHLMIAPLRGTDGAILAVLLAMRETAFGEGESAAAERLSEAFGYCAEALGAGRRKAARRWGRPLALALALATVAALALIPVPLTALAPAEIVARDAFVVTPGIDGIVATVPVDPGQSVRAGDVLTTLVDTTQRNQLAIAEQEVAVADAKWRQISLGAFGDAAARRELSIAASDLELKRAERNFAADMLARTVIRAERDGVAVFADKRELLGRPVQAGQRLLEIADPARLLLRAEAHVDDAVLLERGARVRFFPDSDPLRPLETTVETAAHQARQNDSGSLSFRVDSGVPAEATQRLRIGHRGTAQILGADVSLAFYLLRRPLSALRQRFGL
ncbi:MAG: HlyD family efflux transporter periplasmic adaptor subunit [Methylobacteriaceae bacterium]|nr:HlyD family efflux transporter periplasmic adaptor subunit [Methylobacteriaceae bacterium]